MYYMPVDTLTFIRALAHAQSTSDTVRDATTSAYQLIFDLNDRCYLSDDSASGFCVRQGGELVGVFSLVKGRGDSLVASATRRGAYRLDCFDGYLPTLYAKHGFVITKRVANWTPGAPDVVYMRRGGL